ncbi:MAG: methylmalonyl-CoA mutase family protein [Acidimicrobiales bacterium]
MTDLDLAAGFPSPDRTAWVDAVDKVLRGKSFERVLVTTTRDGLDIQPLYTERDVDDARRRPGVVPFAPHERVERGWDVRQQHDGADPASCADGIVAELERGVTSVELLAPAAGWTIDSLREALHGVLTDLAPVALVPHAGAASAARCMRSSRSAAISTPRSWLGLDPIGEWSVEEPRAPSKTS